MVACTEVPQAPLRDDEALQKQICTPKNLGSHMQSEDLAASAKTPQQVLLWCKKKAWWQHIPLVRPVLGTSSRVLKAPELHADLGRDFAVCEQLLQDIWASPQRIAGRH